VRALVLTNEYPPEVYGGAGVHVAELTRHLRTLIEVDVRTFGSLAEEADGWRVRGYSPAGPSQDAQLRPVIDAFSRNLAMVADAIDADVVHCHTWYTHLAGVLASRARGLPLAVTVHSLEPLRPWKREQLGGGYALSSWVERTALESADAVVAVSRGTRDDVLRLFAVDPARAHVIHNGIDADTYRPAAATDALERHRIDPARPYVLFLGRVTRQKGISHFLRAIDHLDPGIAIVLCAGQPDTPEIAAEVESAVAAARSSRDGVVWIREMVTREDARQLYSHAAAFCCPSVYEPFGIINLEAAACETPVVASAIGGIPEVVVDGETGILVPVAMREDDPMTPVEPDRFAQDLASALNALVADPARAERMGRAGRRRAVEQFSWASIARQTVDLYRSLTG
jgi:glycogen synthase